MEEVNFFLPISHLMLLQFSAIIYKQDKRTQDFSWKKVVQKNESAWKHICIVKKISLFLRAPENSPFQ